MRQIRSTAIAVLVIGALAAASASVAAQGAPEQEIGVAAVSNADRVDGRHAVSASTKVKRRAGKLVATDKRGYLPSNIVKPKWAFIKNKPASFRDGIIRWNEVANMPGGFRDKVDNLGVTNATLTRVTGNESSGSGSISSTAVCPVGSKVTGGGFDASDAASFTVSESLPANDLSHWHVDGMATASVTLTAYAVCMNMTGGTITVAKKGK